MDEYLCRTAFTPYYPSYLFLSFLHKSALSDKQGRSKKYSFRQVTGQIIVPFYFYAKIL